MSRVKERENVLCADVTGRETYHGRARLQRPGAGSSFHSHSINRTDSQTNDQNSFHNAGWKIIPRAVFETSEIQQTALNLEMNRKGVHVEWRALPELR
jgi:hypothetical protein